MIESAAPYGQQSGEPVCPDCGDVADHTPGNCDPGETA